AQLAGRRRDRPLQVPRAAPARRIRAATAGLGGRGAVPRPVELGGMSAVGAHETTARTLRLGARSGRLGALAAWSVVGLATLLILLWVLFLAPTTGKLATTFGSAVDDPKDFLITLLNGLTAAGLYFVVAS